ncbi:hypothetical protein [Paenibacillus pseudetheri]|nr:hypothetical protein [Paenibacillus pseudetheri]
MNYWRAIEDLISIGTIGLIKAIGKLLTSVGSHGVMLTLKY